MMPITADIPPRKSALVDLHEDTDPRALVSAPVAFGRIATECLDQWRTNQELLLHSRAVEHLHQMRVGIRRLRSAVSLFRRALPRLRAERRLIVTLRAGALPFGLARDLDVLLMSPLVEPLSAAALAQLRTERDAAYDVTLTILASPLWRQVGADVQSLVDAIALPPSDPGPGASGPGESAPLLPVAAAALERRWRLIAADGTDLTALTAERRHEVRIEAKKLRYGLEFLHSAFPAPEPRRTTESGGVLTGALACAGLAEDLQSALGVLNDHASAERLLYSVGIHAPEVDTPALLARAQDAHRAVAAMPRVWALEP